MSKITNHEINNARHIMALMGEDETKVPKLYHEILEDAGVDIAVIEKLIERIRKEGKLPEEKHRYQASGTYQNWVDGCESMPDEILNEFTTKDGIVQITEEEFLDILAYVAESYYG